MCEESLPRSAHPVPPAPVPCPPMYLLATRETSFFHSNTCCLSSKLVKRLEGLPISSKPATHEGGYPPGPHLPTRHPRSACPGPHLPAQRPVLGI